MGKYSKYLSEIGNGKHICLLCCHEFNQQKDSCTSVWSYHFKKKHPNEWMEIQRKRSSEQEEDEPMAKKIMQQATIAELLSNFAAQDAKNKTVNRSIMQLIASASLPINLIDNPAWKNFCSIAMPEFNCEDKKHFQKVELNNLYDEYKKTIHDELKTISFVSIGLEKWTDSSDRNSHLGVIVYFTKNDTLASRVIGVIEVDVCDPEYEYVMQKLESVLMEYNIEKKISAVVQDEGFNVAGITKFQETPNFNCFGHKLDIAFKENANVFEFLSCTLDSLKDKSKIVNSSVKNRRDFEEVRKTLDVSQSALETADDIRWNTIHVVFERALKVRNIMDNIEEDSSECYYWTKIEDSYWETMQNVVEILQPIVDATLLIQNQGMTSSAIIPLCKVIIRELNDAKKHRSVCSTMAAKLREALLEYERNEYLQIGMMLDIRFKDKFVDKKWRNILLDKLMETTNREGQTFSEALEVALLGIPDNPFSRFMKTETPETSTRTTLSSRNDIIRAEHNKWFCESSDMDQNPIAYWNRASSRENFPNLYQLQHKYLCTPASSLETDKLFSLARTVCTDNINLLNAEDFAKLLFLQRNIKLLGFAPQNIFNG